MTKVVSMARTSEYWISRARKHRLAGRYEEALAVLAKTREKYGTGCVCVNCLELSENDISEILKSALCEFPLSELDVFLPSWVDALPIEHPLRTSLYNGVRASAQSIHRIRDVYPMADTLRAEDNILSVSVAALQMGRGIADIRVDLPRALYYQTISEQSGFAIRDDGDLMALLTEMRGIKNEYDRISADKAYLESVMVSGRERASAIAYRTMLKVRKKVGLAALKL